MDRSIQTDTDRFKLKKQFDSLHIFSVLSSLNIKQIQSHWDEILRLATSIKQGTVTASLVLRKLGSYPRQNGLAIALRELGRIERDLFMLDWFQNIELRPPFSHFGAEGPVPSSNCSCQVICLSGHSFKQNY